MIDMVIDTCTLVHAENQNIEFQSNSIELINKMFTNTTKIVVDEGFTFEEASNKSYIGLEYITHLKPGTLGFALIVHLATNLRINFVSNEVSIQEKKYIEKIIKNKKDRMFLRVTINSSEKILASHDFTDFQEAKRKKIKKDLNVIIETAEDVCKKL